ncbi:glutathione peroxidase gpx1 [Mortierella sp. AD011]|nr:glutathione peroxidase gpx1 [Mortierella sp. AD010]KAF9402533.1 glutathione peroxidase gpx1 [Mortierella sp. AD011]
MMHRATSFLGIRLIKQRAGATAVRAVSSTPIFHARLRRDLLAARPIRSFATSVAAATMVAADAGSGSKAKPNSFFDLKAKNKSHQEVSMEEHANKVILVVNVASKCGFTGQYKELEQLYKDYKDRGFVVIGFPCNQFGKQIESFCKLNYGVTFPIMDKIDVNGSNEDPVYAFLKSQKAGILGLTRIKWNFEKFLINKDGTVYQRYSSTTDPSEIAGDIEKLLSST